MYSGVETWRKLEQLIESDWCSYEVLYDFDADEYCSIYQLDELVSDEFLTVNQKQVVKSNGMNLGSGHQLIKIMPLDKS